MVFFVLCVVWPFGGINMEVNTSIVLSLLTFIWICFWVFAIHKLTKTPMVCCLNKDINNFTNHSLSIMDCKIVHIEQDISNLQNEIHKLKFSTKK